MILVRFASAAALFMLAGCGSGETSTAPASPNASQRYRPLLATVILHDVCIAPTKADGTPWDWPSPDAEPQLRKSLDAALALGGIDVGFRTVLGIFARPATQALAKPDVYGYADMFRGPGVGPDRRSLPVLQDTFAPAWGDEMVWRSVMLVPSTHLGVHLVDKDLQNDDPIGDVELGLHELTMALAHGGNVPIPVSDQGERQVLYVGLSVTPEIAGP